MEWRQVTARGIDFVLADWPGEGTPMVLLHGVSNNALWWDTLARSFAGRRVIAFDMPGHGQTGSCADFTLDALAAAVTDATRQVFDGKVIWGGHSWGGKLAPRIAARYPELTAGLLLIEPAPLERRTDWTVEGLLSILDPIYGPFSTLDEALQAQRAMPHFRRWNPAVERAAARGFVQAADGQYVLCSDREVVRKLVPALIHEDAAADLPHIRCPMLVLLSEEDEDAESTRRHFAPEQVRMLPGNHWLHTDAPEATGAAVAGWLSQHRL
jgi:pimeloyl-ACP methyl ester carboxylesterase